MSESFGGGGSREMDCGVLHQTIPEAIEHAEKLLGSWRQPMNPYRGTTRQNQDVVVGWQLSPRRRYRLDFSETTESTEEPKWVHVNQEDFDAPERLQKIVHRVDSKKFEHVVLFYRKWTARYGYPRG